MSPEMTPTPSATPLVHSSARLWTLAAVFAAFGLLLLAGLVVGIIRTSPTKARRSAGRAAVAFDATLAPQGRREALEYLLHDQHRVILEQEKGDDDGDDDKPAVVFQYPREDNSGPHTAD